MLVQDAFGEVEIVSQLALKREVSVYERDMEEDDFECWGQFYTGAVRD